MSNLNVVSIQRVADFYWKNQVWYFHEKLKHFHKVLVDLCVLKIKDDSNKRYNNNNATRYNISPFQYLNDSMQIRVFVQEGTQICLSHCIPVALFDGIAFQLVFCSNSALFASVSTSELQPWLSTGTKILWTFYDFIKYWKY